jgi:hypothetical protein
MKCARDPACPFPSMLGSDFCLQHDRDRQLPFTLHEMNDRVRCLEQEGDLWRGFSHQSRAARERGRPKLTEKEKIERRDRYVNTYCQAVLPAGARCNVPIPISERICDPCKQRLLPDRKEESKSLYPSIDAQRCPHGYANEGNCLICRPH